MKDRIDNSINALTQALHDGKFSTQANDYLYVGIELLKQLKNENLSEEQIREKQDVIMLGVLMCALKSVQWKGYLPRFDSRYGINSKENPFLKQTLSYVGDLDYKEKDDVQVLAVGANLLFNKNKRKLFRVEDYNPDGAIAKALFPWMKERLEKYNDPDYKPKNIYPLGNLSQEKLIERLETGSDKKSLLKKVKKFNKEYGTNFNVERASDMVEKIKKAKTIAEERGYSLDLSPAAKSALQKLSPGVREWLLQAYKLLDRRNLHSDLVIKITSLVLDLPVKDTRAVFKHVNYALHATTKSSGFFKKSEPVGIDKRIGFIESGEVKKLQKQKKR